MKISAQLKRNLVWLLDNWERKKLDRSSEYGAKFHKSLKNIINNCENKEDVELVVKGTLGKVADGYAHILDVEVGDLANDPWVALRRLGDISKLLRMEYDRL